MRTGTSQQIRQLAARNVAGPRHLHRAASPRRSPPKNRVMFSHEYQLRCEGSTLTRRATTAAARAAPTGLARWHRPRCHRRPNTGYFELPYYVTQATWTAPLTSSILLEAGFSRFAYCTTADPGTAAAGRHLRPDPGHRAVTRPSTAHRRARTSRIAASTSYPTTTSNPNNWRASASYVTGAHNMKVGYQGSYSDRDNRIVTNDTLLAYRFNNGSRISSPSGCRIGGQPIARHGGGVLRAGHLDARAADAAGRAALRPRVELQPGRRQRDRRTSRFNAAPITFERTPGVDAYQRHHAARRRRLRRVRQRQDGDQVQFRPLSRAGDQRQPLHAEQPGEPRSSRTRRGTGPTPTATTSSTATS